MSAKITTEEFINRGNIVHNGKYRYTLTCYKKAKEKVCIICPKHGEFWQTPDDHLHGKGCPKCGREIADNTRRIDLETFIERSNIIHNYKYDYSKAIYINISTKICIICPEHGEFWQTPASHLRGKGCPKCAGKGLTNEEIIEKCRLVHGDKYDYSNIKFVNMKDYCRIICPIHGEFWQTMDNHLHGHECPKCSNSSEFQ